MSRPPLPLRGATAATILGLALPALGALAAEPLYLLVDTAIVGHLGSTPLAGLAVAGTVLAALLGLATFLEYGTTGAVARLAGAGRRAEALDTAVQATWLAAAVGAALALAVEIAAAPALRLVGGGDDAVHEQALAWIRIAGLGTPFVCVTLAGQGWLRGLQNTTTPFVVILGGNAASAALSWWLVYGAHLGIRGSAIANAVAQSGSAVIFGVLLRRRGASMAPSWPRMRRQLRTARDLSVRTLAFLFSFTTATAVAARMGGTTVAAHQVAIQLWEFLALVLDSLAIAAQALVGTAVGAGDIPAARALSSRLTRWGAAFGGVIALLLLAGWDVVPRLFTGDSAVVDAAHSAWPYLALMQPAAGVVFALDGILIGAGDTAFLARVTVFAGICVYMPLAILAGVAHLGLGGVWAGLTAFVLVRLATCVWRARGDRWWIHGLRHAAGEEQAELAPV